MDVQEQLCYIPCSFCNIVLAVSVPYSNLFDVVTVRCGHCTNMWRVNIGAAALLHHHQQGQVQQDAALATATLVHNNNININNVQRSTEYKVDLGSSSKWNNNNNKKLGVNYSITNKPKQRTVNQPPEKRQRVPSAYNQFIKEEIQRIKTNNPDITHREAFSTAAKNWAHFPHIHFGLTLQTNNRV